MQLSGQSKRPKTTSWTATNDKFPLHLWDKQLPHAELALNLLRGSRINPKLSAWEQIHGRFDFNRTPIAPPGIKVLVHEKSKQRTTWAPHAQEGWYLGPALESYRCHKVYLDKTQGERIVNTLSWYPQAIAIPIAQPRDLFNAALQDVQAALQKPAAGNLATSLTQTETEKLHDLIDILTNVKDTADPDPEWIDTIKQPIEIAKTVRFTEEAKQNTMNTLRKHTKYPMSPAPEDAPALRVEPKEYPLRNRMQVAPDAPPLWVPPHRKSKPRAFFAATDTAVIEATKLLDQENDVIYVAEAPKEFALKAVNPDTGLDAEYPELLKSSDSHLWTRSMCHEIG